MPFARTVVYVPDIPFGFSLPGAQPPDPFDPQQMQQFMAQLQQMFAGGPGSGPVNWDLARQVAASQLTASGDPAVNMFELHQVEESLRLADLWLDPASALETPRPAGPRRRWLGDPMWARPALWTLLAATAVLYLWDLGASGWANEFYAASAQAGSQSWKAS